MAQDYAFLAFSPTGTLITATTAISTISLSVNSTGLPSTATRLSNLAAFTVPVYITFGTQSVIAVGTAQHLIAGGTSGQVLRNGGATNMQFTSPGTAVVHLCSGEGIGG